MEALRDRLMFGVGTDEPFIAENLAGLEDALGHAPTAMQWRKPLRIDEIARMAQTPEVRERRGRP